MRAALILLLFAFACLNGLAFFHARAATHFVREGGDAVKISELDFTGKLKILFTGVQVPRPVLYETPEDRGWAATTERFVTDDGLELEAWRIPREDARFVVVLFHGYSGSRSGHLAEAGRFLALGCEPWLVDFRGSGGSDGETTSLGYHEARDVEAAWEHVREATGSEPLLYGVSMGAVAILRAVHEKRVQPRAVILESPFDRMLSTIQNRFAILGVPSFPSAQLMTFWGGVLLDFDALDHNPIEYARALDAPALFHYGGKDARVFPHQSLAVIEQVAGNVTIHEFTELGHQSFVRAAGDEWTESVEAFLQALE